MSTLERFAEIAKRAVSISIEQNEHHGYYETAEQFLTGIEDDHAPHALYSDEMRTEMISRDSIVHIQCYPETPIGSWSVYHWDLEQAMLIAIRTFEFGR